MNRLIEWFARNSVAANLLAVLIILTGIIAYTGTRKEVFPEFSSDMITVTVDYLGAAPAEVEEGVCVRIEEAIQSLEGIKKITSTAGEGFGTVAIELLPEVNVREVMDDVKTQVDAIDTFPVRRNGPSCRRSSYANRSLMWRCPARLMNEPSNASANRSGMTCPPFPESPR